MAHWIVTADDLGFSPLTNEAILRLARERRLTNASLMVNMPFCEEILPEIAAQVPWLGVGLHFTLTSGRSVAEPAEVPALVDSNGQFRLSFGDLWKQRHSVEFLRQVRLEFEAQYARAESLLAASGLKLAHIDSHQHVHAIPGIFDLAAERALQAGLRLRIPFERFGSLGRFFRRLSRWFPMGLVKREVLRLCLRPGLKRFPQLPRTEYVGILDSGHVTTAAWRAIRRAYERQDVTLEVNLHPATSCDLSPYASQICCSKEDFRFWSQKQRVLEYEAAEVPPQV